MTSRSRKRRKERDRTDELFACQRANSKENVDYAIMRAIIVFHSFSRSANVLLGYSSPYLIVQSLSRLISCRR